MPLRVLVLHGPNLNLASDAGRPLEALDAQLVSRAAAQGAEVRCFQANAEGALLDELHRHRAWLDAVIINPSSLSTIAFGLADALALLKKPAVEVQLAHEVPGRGRSALKAVVEKQFHGHGFEGYLKALEALTRHAKSGAVPRTVGRAEAKQATSSAPPAKTIGRKAQHPPPGQPDAASSGKTIGRKAATGQASDSEAAAFAGVTRSLVRAKLAERLSGRLPVEAFVKWAREQYRALQSGAPVEAGQQALLEDVLMMMSASTKAADDLLISTMARLES